MKKYEKLAASFLAVLLIITFIIPSYVKAEDIGYTWAKQTTPGGGSDTVLTASVTDSSGNVYSVGAFSSTVDFDPGAGTANLVSAAMGQDIFVYKLDASGNYIWAKKIGVNNSDAAYAVALDSSENVYVTGYFIGTVDFDPGAGTANLAAGGTADIFILKLDSSGNYVWAKNFGGTGYGQGSSIKVASDGSVYSGGSFNGTIDFDPGASTTNLTSAGGDDIFISKLDSNGDYVWVKKIGAAGSETTRSVVLDSSNNPIVIGEFGGTVDFDPDAGTASMTASGFLDIYIVKLDSDGNYIFSKALQGSSIGYGKSLALDTSGNIYAAGHFTGTIDFDPGAGSANLTSAGNDIFIVKLNSSGDYIWSKKFLGGDATKNIAITLDSSGNSHTAGYFTGTVDFDPGAGTINLAGGSGSIFTLKLDSSGNFTWAKVFGAGGAMQHLLICTMTLFTSQDIFKEINLTSIRALERQT